MTMHYICFILNYIKYSIFLIDGMFQVVNYNKLFKFGDSEGIL